MKLNLRNHRSFFCVLEQCYPISQTIVGNKLTSTSCLWFSIAFGSFVDKFGDNLRSRSFESHPNFTFLWDELPQRPKIKTRL